MSIDYVWLGPFMIKSQRKLEHTWLIAYGWRDLFLNNRMNFMKVINIYFINQFFFDIGLLMDNISD